MTQRGFASAPCYMRDLDDGAGAVWPADTGNAVDVARWRKAMRENLIDARLCLTPRQQAAAVRQIAAALDAHVGPCEGANIAVYWPLRGEPDLRDWMCGAVARGARIALPEVVGKAQPLVFREWVPGCAMRRDALNIPVPDTEGQLTPDIVIAPVVGADLQGYRLGYGCGFYDRTLAALTPRRKAIGVGHLLARLPTIIPQPHDIPLDAVILADPAQGQAQ